MERGKLKNLEKIIGQSYEDPGKGGKPIQNLYSGIRDNNPELSNHELMEVLINLIEFLLNNRIVRLAGKYDYDNEREVEWEGSNEELIRIFKEWIEKYPREKLENDPEYFFDFKYCFMVWQIQWLEVLKKFNL